MKKIEKLLPAIFMMLVSVALLASSTFAWFSMNKTVTVTGMVVKVRGTDNVMIANADEIEEAFNNSDDTEELYDFSIEQQITANLRPASTVDGVNFYYADTKGISSTGALRDPNGTYISYGARNASDGSQSNSDPEEVVQFNRNYGLTSYTNETVVFPYVDYEFYIKATNSAESAQTLRMSRCNLLYNYEEYGWATKAWRVALFVKKTDADTPVPYADIVKTANNNATLTSILAPFGAEYFADDKAVSANDEIDDVIKLGVDADLDDIDAGDTCYYRVVVRLWLEGEDKTCKTDTFARLSEDWSLELAFSLDDGNGIDEIGSETTASIAASGNLLMATLNNIYATGETAVRYEWTDGNSTSYSDENSFVATNSGDFYCVIVTDIGSRYRTKSVHVDDPDIIATYTQFDDNSDRVYEVAVADTYDSYQWYSVTYNGSSFVSAPITSSDTDFVGYDTDTLRMVGSDISFVYCVATDGADTLTSNTVGLVPALEAEAAANVAYVNYMFDDSIGETVSSITWYEQYDNTTPLGTGDSYENTTGYSVYVYCVVVTNESTYISNAVELQPAD